MLLYYAKVTKIASVYNQLSLIQYNLNWEFRFNIFKPIATTSIQQFFEQLDSKADVQYKMAKYQNKDYGKSLLAILVQGKKQINRQDSCSRPNIITVEGNRVIINLLNILTNTQSHNNCSNWKNNIYNDNQT